MFYLVLSRNPYLGPLLKMQIPPFPSPGDLPSQGLNSGLLDCRQILSHQGSPTPILRQNKRLVNLELDLSALIIQAWFFATHRTVAHQAPLSVGFSRQEHWSGLPFPSPGVFPTQGLSPVSCTGGRFFTVRTAAAAAAAKSRQSCPTLCNPIDHSPPGSPVPGILQARTLEWVALSFSNAWEWKWSRSFVPDS